jgi:hypothetical protein
MDPIYSYKDLEDYSAPWSPAARERFRKHLSEKLRGCGPVLDLDAAFLRKILQFMVRYRSAANRFMDLARKYKVNIPRMSQEDFEASLREARVSEVMES